MRVFLSAGEASGDAYGAEIVAALDAAGAFSSASLARDLVREFTSDAGSRSNPAKDIAATYGGQAVRSLGSDRSSEALTQAVATDLDHGAIDAQRLRRETIAAIGAKRLREAGVGLTIDSSGWGAVGIAESLAVAPKVLEGFLSARSLLTVTGPGLFIPIDYGYVNVKLAREAKRLGWKVLYFSPPGAWRRDKQGSDLPQVTDAIVTPFPWSAKILNERGANAHFFGHPIKEMVAKVPNPESRSGLAVLPGSRGHEVFRNMKVIAEATRDLGVSLTFAVAQNLQIEQVRDIWRDAGGGDAEFSHETNLVLKSSVAAIVCSGTATLEAALCRCPLVVVYRGSKVMEIEAAIRRPRFDYISLPNILLERQVLPELIQRECTPERVRQELVPLIEDSASRRAQLTAFEELDGALGGGRCFEQTAELAMELGRALA